MKKAVYSFLTWRLAGFPRASNGYQHDTLLMLG